MNCYFVASKICLTWKEKLCLYFKQREVVKQMQISKADEFCNLCLSTNRRIQYRSLKTFKRLTQGQSSSASHYQQKTKKNLPIQQRKIKAFLWLNCDDVFFSISNWRVNIISRCRICQFQRLKSYQNCK